MEISRISFEKLQNTRDLGQFTTQDGRKIRPRRLLRSGSLNRLSLEDRAILQNDYQLKLVLDFRTATEKGGEPDTKIHGVTYEWLPILDEETIGISRETEESADGLQMLADFLMRPGFNAKEYMTNTYLALVKSSFSRRQYRKFFDILLDAPEDGAVLWHCSAGKDRVGIGTALLLSALGVAREDIIDDYLATNTFYADTLNQMIAVLTEKAGTKEIIPSIDAFFSVQPQYIECVFDCIDREFSGIDAFLEQEMGLDEQRRTALQDKYLTK